MKTVYLPIGKFGVSFALLSNKFPVRDIMPLINDTVELGKALRQARKQLRLTQPQLALASGVGVRFIVDLEAGKPNLPLAQALRVIAALGGEIQLNGLPGISDVDSGVEQVADQ